jgi:hypothetical protein
MLTKLLEIDLELTVQEAELMVQLEGVQEKRRSLKSVINMFTPADTPAIAPPKEPIEAPPAETSRESKPVTEELAAPPLESSTVTYTADSKIAAALDTEFKGAKTTPSTRRNKTTKTTTKVAKKAPGWQKYMRGEFGKVSLPEAVSTVLKRQPDQVFEIPAIVNAIFTNELPMQPRSNVRRQITNILSEGVKDNKWYRGKSGYYSISKAAAEGNLAS